MSRAWLIDSRGLATKVKNASLPPSCQIKDCGAKRECPNCQFVIDNKDDIYNDWPGLPAGVKFDPTDIELIEHLAEKCGVGDSMPHMFIQEFIPTLDTNEGICFTHPENLPGARKDGSSVHFFYQIRNAYATGQRKRRRIETQNDTEQNRWHKTGKTKPVMDNGVQKGWKKIMVLYVRNSKKGSKSEKSNWVMHQYHLGAHEEEKEGEYVVSKVFYQQQKPTDTDVKGKSLVVEESDVGSVWTIPRTPTTVVPSQLRLVETPSCEEIQSLNQGVDFVQEDYNPSNFEAQSIDEMENVSLAGESQAYDQTGLNNFLWCNERFDPVYSNGYDLYAAGPSTSYPEITNDVLPSASNTYSGIPDPENVDLDTPPDFQLTDLPFSSQDSILGWLDRL